MPSSQSTFCNLSLHQRVNPVSPFISTKVWKENGAAPGELDPKLPCYAGLDLPSSQHVTTSPAARNSATWDHVHRGLRPPLSTPCHHASRASAPCALLLLPGCVHRKTPSAAG